MYLYIWTFGDQGKGILSIFFSTIEAIKRRRIFRNGIHRECTHIPMKLHYAERYYERDPSIIRGIKRKHPQATRENFKREVFLFG